VLKRMEVTSQFPGAPAIPLGGFMPNDDPVQIRKIDGLGPVKSDISSTPFATGRGELFQGNSTGKRNIVLTLGLNPNWQDQTMTSLRQLLYRYFMPENWSMFRFITDDLPTVYINGVVESFEPNIFEQDPEIQVSILCPKPDFIDVDATLITVRSTRHVYNVMLPDQPIKQEINILAKMGKTSDWPELLPGGNLFSVGSSAAGLRWILAYFNRYGGL
jgi:hypothetical protein